MRKLLQFIVDYLEILYLNPRYRFTDSANRGLAEIDASITLTGDRLVWQLNNDRGQLHLAIAPIHRSSAEHWFWLPLVRQYLDGANESRQDSPIQQATWLADHLDQLEQLFADDTTSNRICEELVALRRSNSSKKWGWP
jgi:hypothetical protein